MAIQWACACGQELLADDQHAGRKTRCPICKRTVGIPGTRRVPAGGARGDRELDDEDDKEDERPRRRGGLSNRAPLDRARVGLGLIWGKFLCFLIITAFALLGCLVLLIATLAASGGARGEGPAFLGVLAIVFTCVTAIALFVMPILGAIGSLMCIWLPERSGGRVLSAVAGGLDGAAGLFLIVGIIMNASASASLGLRRNLASFEDLWMTSKFVMGLILLAYLLMLAGWILNMVVLKNLAAYVRDRVVAGDAVRMLIIGLVTLFVPAVLIGILIPTLGPRAGLAGAIVIEVLLIVWTAGLLAVSFKLLNLTSTVRHLM